VGGVERVYFSTKDSETGPWQIYYLAGTTPKLYTTIDPQQLTFPNPSGGPDFYHYSGDFAFGDDTLYLSSGNVHIALFGYGQVPVGIYKVAGAGPDMATGTVERIYLDVGPIECLCYQDPQILYYFRQGGQQFWKLDLSTMTASLQGWIQLQQYQPYLYVGVFDVAYVPDGLQPYFVYWFIEATKNLLKALSFKKS
jgi:hypothetical protein